MNRRGFLTRSGLALGALIVGDEMLEAMDRLTHVRKTFPSAPTTVSVGEVSLYVRAHKFAPWVLHETVPLHGHTQHAITFRKPIPVSYPEGQLRTTLYDHAPSMTINVYAECL